MTALSEIKKYQVYPEYKNSEVDWVGFIPSHWIVTSLKRYAYVKGGFAFSSDLFGDAGKPVIRIGDIKQDGSISLESCKYVPAVVAENSQEYLVSKGQLLMAMTGATIGKAGIYNGEYPALVNQRVGRFQVYDDKLSYRFLWYVLKTLGYQEYIRLTAFGGAQPNISDTAMVAYDSAFPPLGEQTQIANFLDHETAKIDALIEKQQQLISLLQEKRQAVISHAVTKGLNPDVPMKDSGVEWLGEVPEHWVVSRIKNFAKIDSGHTPSRQVEEYWIDCNIPWVSLSDSKTLKIVDYIDDTSNKINELGMANSSAHLLPERSVVFTRDASIGLSAIISKPMAVSQHLIAWICNDSKLIPEFLLLIFYAMENEFERYTFGATIKTIGMDDVRSLSGAFPPLEEQRVLVEWAFQKIASLKNGIDKAESIVELLKERRTALISAAVTGKIDVRNWQAPSQSPTTSTEEQAL
ncbi:Type I restriction enzyme EcoKI specificity protein [Plesiomonas shigelloides]|uniref:restriction endonuclease subunit S n=1 Tax=Plesiomonas shigelloides TaxID=703 RepID=UPI0007F159A3|nr:restriction endonuclease subunit S [Plesiomonas shigelloides]SBT59822.1 Type I restriction enzyme EcoKI specificity protein [Plesiomonas shigelloides]